MARAPWPGTCKTSHRDYTGRVVNDISSGGLSEDYVVAPCCCSCHARPQLFQSQPLFPNGSCTIDQPSNSSSAYSPTSIELLHSQTVSLHLPPFEPSDWQLDSMALWDDAFTSSSSCLDPNSCLHDGSPSHPFTFLCTPIEPGLRTIPENFDSSPPFSQPRTPFSYSTGASSPAFPGLGSESMSTPMTVSSPLSEPTAQKIVSGSLKRKGKGHSPRPAPERISKCSNAIKTFHCQWEGCGRFLPNLEVLRKHVRSHSTQGSCCKWLGCIRATEQRSSLNKHLDSHVKPHVCPEVTCSHRAAKARDLKRHMLSHRILPGTEIYYCPSPGCDHSRDGANRSFARFDNAARHIKKKHPALDEKPLRCIHAH